MYASGLYNIAGEKNSTQLIIFGIVTPRETGSDYFVIITLSS